MSRRVIGHNGEETQNQRQSDDGAFGTTFCHGTSLSRSYRIVGYRDIPPQKKLPLGKDRRGIDRRTPEGREVMKGFALKALKALRTWPSFSSEQPIFQSLRTCETDPSAGANHNSYNSCANIRRWR